MEIIEIDTLEELDNYLHEQVIDHMKSEECGLEILPKEPVKLVLSQKILNMSSETIIEILQMKSIERALNDPYLKDNHHKMIKNDENLTFENTILPILSGNKKVTYH